MRLSRVKIENFRNFKLLEVSDFPRKAVIVGENGIGKSNFLHALRLVLDPDLPDSARALRSEDICEWSEPTFETGARVTIEVDFTDIAGDQSAEALCDGCFTSLDPLTARFTYVFEPRAAEPADRPLTRRDYQWGVFGGPNSESDARRLRSEVSLHVLPALRDAVNELSRWRGSPLQEILEYRRPTDEALKATASGLNDVMKDLARDENLTAVNKDIATRLENLAGPRLDLNPTLGFASSVPGRLLRSIRLFVDTERTRTVADTSTGSANVIYLAMLLERFGARVSSDLILRNILAVEEPEAHIHPVLQRQLFRYLLRQDGQLAVTTHSPHIAAVSQLDSIVLLRADSEGGTVASLANVNELSPLEKSDLERYLDVSRAEILFCNFAIFVEGIAEVYLLPELAAAFNFDLDAYGVIITNISGVDFQPYRKLVRNDSLNIDHAIVTDGDPVTRTGKIRFAGLRRGARLGPAAKIEARIARIDNMCNDASDIATGVTREARATLSTEGVFIGCRTLELDILPLLAVQMIEAYNQLDPSESLQDQFGESIAKLLEDDGEDGDDGDRQEVLRRINGVSKGRYAQRLAACLEESSVEIRSVVLQAALSFGEETGDLDDDDDDDAARSKYLEYFADEDWFSLGSYGYILAALDRASRTVRGYGLLCPPRATQEDRVSEQQEHISTDEADRAGLS